MFCQSRCRNSWLDSVDCDAAFWDVAFFVLLVAHAEGYAAAWGEAIWYAERLDELSILCEWRDAAPDEAAADIVCYGLEVHVACENCSVRMSHVVICICGNEDEHRCTIKEFSSLRIERFTGVFFDFRQIFFVRDDGEVHIFVQAPCDR